MGQDCNQRQLRTTLAAHEYRNINAQALKVSPAMLPWQLLVTLDNPVIAIEQEQTTDNPAAQETYCNIKGSIGNSNGLFHGRPAPLAAVPLGRAPAGPRCRAWPGRGAGDRPPARLGLLGEDC